MASETQRFISVIGAAEHNLRNIDVQIPRDALTVIIGISESGESSPEAIRHLISRSRRNVFNPATRGDTCSI